MDVPRQMEEPNANFEGELPLLGLCDKPMHLMTPEERRAKVAEIQELRTSSLTWRARMASEAADEINNTTKPKSPPKMDALADLL